MKIDLDKKEIKWIKEIILDACYRHGNEQYISKKEKEITTSILNKLKEKK